MMPDMLSNLRNTVRSFLTDEHGGTLRFTSTLTSSAAVAISVLAEQQVLSAPYQVNLDAIVTDLGISAPATSSEYDEQFHDIEYIWSVEKVGNPSYATSTYSAVPDLPTHMKTKGTKYGKRICHVIGIGDVVAGETNTFRFTVTAINLATGASATSAVLERTIAHPDDFFSADETFVVRKSSATNHPATNNSYYSEVTSAISAAAATSLTKVRIVAERGQSYAAGTRDLDNATGTAMLFDTWGSGTASLSAGANGGFAILRGIGANYASFQISGFTVTGPGLRAFTFQGSNAVENKVLTISDCNVDGAGILFQRVDGGFGGGWMAFSNVDASGCYNMLVVSTTFGASASFIALKGTHSPDQTSDNGDERIVNGADGGGGYGLRFDGADQLVYISQCDFFQRQGWFNNAPGYADGQPWLRLKTNTTQKIVIDRVASETGFKAMQHENISEGPHYSNMLIDKCLFIGQSDTAYFMEFAVPQTIRNCIFIKPPSKNVRHNFDEFLKGTPPINSLKKVYNNTFINLSHGTDSGVVNSGTDRVILANNVNHQPNLDTPISAGTFSLTELFTPRYIGYYTAVGGRAPHYQVDYTANTPPFTVGETVTGDLSGVVKTYAGSQERFQSGLQLLFDMSVVFDRLDQAAGFERFTAGETLSGNLGGAATLSAAAVYGQPFDSTSFGIGLIARTKTATHKLAYDGGSGTFTEGETLTATGKSATICQVFDNGDGTGVLYLRDITGTFADNDAITDGTATANANGGQASAGTGALWVPTSAIALESGTWADKPSAVNGKSFTGGTPTSTRGALVIDAA